MNRALVKVGKIISRVLCVFGCINVDDIERVEANDDDIDDVDDDD